MAEIDQKAKEITIALNREKASLILKGISLLPDTDKRNIIAQNLEKEIKNILTIWDRRIKNEQLLKKAQKVRPPTP